MKSNITTKINKYIYNYYFKIDVHNQSTGELHIFKGETFKFEVFVYLQYLFIPSYNGIKLSPLEKKL